MTIIEPPNWPLTLNAINQLPSCFTVWTLIEPWYWWVGERERVFNLTELLLSSIRAGLFCLVLFFPLLHLCWPPSLTRRTLLWLSRKVQSSQSDAQLVVQPPWPGPPSTSPPSLLQAELDGWAEKGPAFLTLIMVYLEQAVYSPGPFVITIHR